MSDRLRILMHAKCFYPSVGGLERVTHNLAAGLWAKGVEVRVLTDTLLGAGAEPGSYPVIRGPSSDEKKRLVRECDLLHINGFSLELLPYSILYRKPLIWRHSGHQASCLEGNGWHAGVFCGHRWWRCGWLACRRRGPRFALRGLAKLFVRRLALRAAARNVCVTQWVADHIRAPHSMVIWNPVDVAAFRASGEAAPPGTFTFVGRLADEKGCDVLIRALDFCRQKGREFAAEVFGDGPEHAKLAELTQRLGLAGHVHFRGMARGAALQEAIGRAWSIVVPTRCEEALGIVAVEAMAAGKPLIVSRRGGLPEVTEGCSLDFANGDHQELAGQMIRLAEDHRLWNDLAQHGPMRAVLFDADRISDTYLQLYREVLERRRDRSRPRSVEAPTESP